jgi:predicted DNA-binding protein (MmcQ/YjbR family)
MDYKTLHGYLLSKHGAVEDYPFGFETMVFKVMGKMFALIPLEAETLRVNLKCEPEWALELRAVWPEIVLPGYHMNKRHWNTVLLEGSRLPDDTVRAMIDHSYDRVVDSLRRVDRDRLAAGIFGREDE